MASEARHILARSALDSARFDLEVWRGHLTGDQAPELWDEVTRVGADVAIVRLPAEDIRAMSRYRGPRDILIHADTLVYYARRLDSASITPPSRCPALYRPATIGDDRALRDVTGKVFAHYQNHYHANPIFPAGKVLAGYSEWAANHLVPGRSTRTWVALREEAIVGFICCSFDEVTRSAEIVLNGVLREHAGQGIYADLVRIAQRHFADMGLETISVSTQIGNYAVQRVWSREGLRLSHAFDTWHLNAMLAHGRQ